MHVTIEREHCSAVPAFFYAIRGPTPLKFVLSATFAHRSAMSRKCWGMQLREFSFAFNAS